MILPANVRHRSGETSTTRSWLKPSGPGHGGLGLQARRRLAFGECSRPEPLCSCTYRRGTGHLHCRRPDCLGCTHRNRDRNRCGAPSLGAAPHAPFRGGSSRNERAARSDGSSQYWFPDCRSGQNPRPGQRALGDPRGRSPIESTAEFARRWGGTAFHHGGRAATQ